MRRLMGLRKLLLAGIITAAMSAGMAGACTRWAFVAQSDYGAAVVSNGAVILFIGRIDLGWSAHVRKREPSSWIWRPAISGHPRTRLVYIPLWLPFAIGAIAAGVGWPHGRRALPDTCSSCRYDLTGNTTGVCPECGAGGAT